MLGHFNRNIARLDLQQEGIQPERNWSVVQEQLRAGRYGTWEKVRDDVCRESSERWPDDGISSSDVNHMAYAVAMCGEQIR